jgi:hypothetical protein
MKKTLITSIAVLFLATGTAHAAEWQCGPHYVSNIVILTGKWGDYGIVVYPFYNRTREEAKKLSSDGDEELSILGPKSKHKNPPTVKGFRWGYAPHPELRGQRHNNDHSPYRHRYRCAADGNRGSARDCSLTEAMLGNWCWIEGGDEQNWNQQIFARVPPEGCHGGDSLIRIDQNGIEGKGSCIFGKTEQTGPKCPSENILNPLNRL